METDQKLLEAILSKSLNQATPRLQEILIRIFAYHFTVRYIPDITNQLADCLSHLGGQKDSIKLPKLQVHQITSHLNARIDSLQEIRVAMQEDDQCALLKNTITHEWPNTIREVPNKIKSFWTFQEELIVEDGIVLKGTYIVILSKKCQSILHLIHEGHLVLAKCKLRVKDAVYWLGLSEDLEKLILNCELCLKYSHFKCKQKPSSSLGQEISVHPWTMFATDIVHFEGSSYLLLVDYTSRFPVVCKLSSMTDEHVANECKLVFSKYGWPDTLISDNGPHYTSQAFTSVMQSYNVNLTTSTPHYPQSNGLAEKYVQIVKSFFYKAKEEGKDFYKCLMIYHNTPHTGIINHLCKFSKAGMLYQTCQCLMLLGNSLVSSLK